VMVFTRQAVDAIFERSGGIPRLISVICDNALISGFAADRRPVGRDIVEDVCRDFDLVSGMPAVAAKAAPSAEANRPAPSTAPRAAAKAPAGASGSTPSILPEPKHPEKPEKGKKSDRSLFEHFSIRRRFSLF
jgi:hypothetical protein